MAGERWMEYLKESSWELSVVCKVGKPILIMYFVLGGTGEVPEDCQKPSDVLASWYNAVVMVPLLTISPAVSLQIFEAS